MTITKKFIAGVGVTIILIVAFLCLTYKKPEPDVVAPIEEQTSEEVTYDSTNVGSTPAETETSKSGLSDMEISTNTTSNSSIHEVSTEKHDSVTYYKSTVSWMNRSIDTKSFEELINIAGALYRDKYYSNCKVSVRPLTGEELEQCSNPYYFDVKDDDSISVQFYCEISNGDEIVMSNILTCCLQYEINHILMTEGE